MNRLVVLAMFFVFSSCPGIVFSAEFYKTGTIQRTLSADGKYGDCMISLGLPVENGCGTSSWVSLDCKGTHVSSNTGERNYASALMAAMQEKKVVIAIDNEKMHGNFCVVTRLDIVF